MMMRRMLPLLLAALLALPFAGCGAASDNDSGPAMKEAPSTGSPAPQSQLSSPPSALPAKNPEKQRPPVTEVAGEVVEALRDRDLARLADWIDPELGLRFSPYSHLNNGDLVFMPEELPSFRDTSKYVWGSYDGSGEPIELTFREYFETFVYDQDYAGAPNVSEGKLTGTGNTPFNGLEVYPEASFVEYHFPSAEAQNSGMDWKSLIVMFVPKGDGWRLCAIVHSQWTI